MEKHRHVKKMQFVFDLPHQIAFGPEENTSTRILFIYDQVKGIKSFKILKSEISEDRKDHITSWLEKNMDNHLHDAFGFIES